MNGILHFVDINFQFNLKWQHVFQFYTHMQYLYLYVHWGLWRNIYFCYTITKTNFHSTDHRINNKQIYIVDEQYNTLTEFEWFISELCVTVSIYKLSKNMHITIIGISIIIFIKSLSFHLNKKQNTFDSKDSNSNKKKINNRHT